MACFSLARSQVPPQIALVSRGFHRARRTTVRLSQAAPRIPIDVILEIGYSLKVRSHATPLLASLRCVLLSHQ
jgi:hypothetical protein